MIDTKVEEFLANTAISVGLPEAIKRGEAVVEGSYSIDKNGSINFHQKNFVFKDKNGELRIGKFADSEELLDFAAALK